MRDFLILVAGSLASGSAVADVYRVGDTNRDACDYETLQSAIDAATANGSGLETILIANTGSYTNVAAVVGDKSLLIEGGFDSCFSALPDVPADLSGNGGDPVISIEPPSLNTQVTLRGLRIHGGGFLGKFGSSGGGVYVTTIPSSRSRKRRSRTTMRHSVAASTSSGTWARLPCNSMPAFRSRTTTRRSAAAVYM